MKTFHLTREHIFVESKRAEFSIKDSMPVIEDSVQSGIPLISVLSFTATCFMRHILKTTDPKILAGMNDERLSIYVYDMVNQEYDSFKTKGHSLVSILNPIVHPSPLKVEQIETFEKNEQEAPSETQSEISTIINSVANKRQISSAHKATLLKIMNGLEGNDATYRPRRCIGMIDEFHNLNDEQLELNAMMSVISSYARVYHDDVVPMHESARTGHGNLHDRTYGDGISDHFTCVEDMIQNLLPLHMDIDTGRVSNLKRFMRYYIIPREEIRENIGEREINNLLATAVEYIQRKWKCYAFATIMPKCVAFFVTTSEIKYNKETKRLERNISSPSASGHTNDPKYTHKSLTVGNKSACWNEFIKGVLHEIRKEGARGHIKN